MAITAKFKGDFSEFYAAVSQATAKFADLKSGAADVEKALNRVANSFGGQKLTQQATLTAKAISDLGGVTKLTATEQQRASAILDEYTAKTVALGQKVPESVQSIADALKAAQAGTVGWSLSLDQLAGGWVATIASGQLLHDMILKVVDVAKELITALPEIALKGASVADVEDNFKRLTEQSGRLGATLLGALRDGTHGTISDFELMKAANASLAAGLNLTDVQFGTLAKGAFALAQATGVTVKEAFDTMNDAMLTGRTRGLALLTGRIDQTAAEQKYAAAIGTTADHLSEAGKVEANRAAILDAVSAATARLGEQTDGLDEHVAQAQVSWANFTEKLGAAIARSEALEAAISGLGKAFIEMFGPSQEEAIANIANAIDQVIIATLALVEGSVRGLNLLRGSFVQTGVEALLTVDALSGGLVNVSKPLADLVARSNAWDDASTKLAASLSDLRAQTAAVAEKQAGLRTLMADVGTIAGDVVGGFDKYGNAITQLNPQLQKHADLTNDAAEAAKKLREEQERLAKLLAGAYKELASAGDSWVDTLNRMDPLTSAIGLNMLKMGVSMDAIKTILGLTETQAKALKNEFEFLNATAGDTATKFATLNNVMGVLAPRFSNLHEYVTGLNDESGNLTATLIDSGTATFTFADQAAYAAAQTEKMRAALAAVHAEAAAFGTAIAGAFAGLPETIARAVEGGGSIIGAFQSLGAQVGAAFSAKFAASVKIGLTTNIDTGEVTQSFVGKLLSGLASGGIGAAIGLGISSLVKLVAGLGGPSKDETAARATFATIQQSGEDLNATIARIGQAYAAMGLSGTRAQSDIQRALDATHVSAAAEQAALAPINQVLQQAADRAAALTKGVETLVAAGTGLPGGLTANVRAAVAGMLNLAGVTDDMRAKLQGLLDNAAPNFQQLDQITQKYGITLESLGTKFNQGDLNAQATQLLDDFQQLTNAGADVGGVLAGMSDKWNEYVHNVLTTKTAIPEALRPILQNLADAGKLTDLSGNKLEDLGDFNFSDTPLQTSQDKLIEALQKLTDSLNSLPATALDAAKGMSESLSTVQVQPIHVPVVFDMPGGATSGAARGGLVTKEGVQTLAGGGVVVPFFRAVGSDTVPAMLTPGEGILTRSATARLGTANLARLNAGGNLNNVVEFSTARLEAKIDKLAEAMLAGQRKLPDQIALASAGRRR